MPSAKNKTGKPICLDNAAAVPCSGKYLQAFTEYALRYPGNQESMAFHGSEAASAVRKAGERVLCALNPVPDGSYSVHFCNSGTEGAAAAVQALFMSLENSFPKGSRILTTPWEHPALLRALERGAEHYGWSLIYCPVTRQGIRMEDLENSLSSEIAAVAVHHVESQTGFMMDLCRLRQTMDRLCPRALLLADTVQSLGKLEVDLEKIRPDLCILSGQKLAVPSCGAVICRGRTGKNLALLRSRDHLYGRSMPAAILTLADALEDHIRDRKKVYDHVVMLGTLLEENFRKYALPFRRTLEREVCSPFIHHYLCTPYQGAILTRSLYSYGVSVAPGSACESETPSGSAVLAAMGYSRQECFCGLRISFSGENTAGEICAAAESLARCTAEY